MGCGTERQLVRTNRKTFTMRSTEINLSRKRGIDVEVSTSDFLDRYIVNSIRVQKLKVSVIPIWIREYTDQACEISNSLGGNIMLVDRLRDVHLALWELENGIRAPATEAVFCETAKRLLALNDERHRLKNEIDRRLPTRCAVEREYRPF